MPAEEESMLQTLDNHVLSFCRNQYDALMGNLTQEQGRHCTCNVTMSRVRITIVAIEKQ